VLTLEGVMHGLYLIWWVQEKHVAAASVALILAAGDLALTALEVPTGWLADRCGHRASLLAGSLLQVVGMLVCWLGSGITGLLAASVVVAAGDAFRSGADQALLYRSLVPLDREGDFQRIEARTHGIQQAALVGMVLAGGAIVRLWGFAAGWIVETALSTIGLAVAFAMVEPPPDDRPHQACADRSPATASGASIGPGRIWLLLVVIAPVAILGSVTGAAAFYVQTADNADPTGMTVLVAILTLAEAAGAALAIRASCGVRLQAMIATAGLIALAAALVVPAFLVPTIAALSLVVGFAEPVRAAALQRVASDDMRARAASIASACDKACATAALVLAGRMPRRRRV
jgi:MFS family permease